MASLGATIGSGFDRSALLSVGAQMEADAEALRHTNAELKKQLEEKNEDLGILKKRIAYFESALVEAHTVACIGAAAVKRCDQELKNSNEAHAAQITELEDRIKNLAERLRVAPQLDRMLVSLYSELRATTTERLRGPPLPDAERSAMQRASPLVVVDKVRIWMRRAFEQIGMLTLGSRRGVFSLDQTIQPLPGEATGSCFDITVNGSPATATQRRKSEVSVRASIGDALRERDELSEELQTLKEAMQDIQREADSEQHKLRSQNFEVRQEAAALRHENRAKEKQLRSLQQQLQQNKVVAVSAVALQNAKHEAQSAKKSMRTVMQAKQQAIESLQRSHEDQVANLTARIKALERQIIDSDRVMQEAEVARATAESARAQLVRADVKSLVEQKKRSLETAQRQASVITSLESQLSAKQNAVKYLETTNRTMSENYAEILRSHTKAAQLRRDEESQRRIVAAAAEIKGANSSLNAEYYKERYEEVLKELKKTQSQMKRLIVLAHHDQLTAEKQQDALLAELKAVEAEMNAEKISRLTMGSPVRNEADRSLERTPLPTENQISQVLAARSPEESATIVTPSYRVDESQATIEVSVPSIGPNTQFGDPLEQDGILRMRTQFPSSEISSRVLAAHKLDGRVTPESEQLSGSISPSASTQIVARIPGKRIRVSPQGGVFHVNRSAAENEGSSSRRSMQRPASALR